MLRTEVRGLRDERGFGLIEIAIALAMIGIVALGAARLFTQSAAGVKEATARTDGASELQLFVQRMRSDFSKRRRLGTPSRELRLDAALLAEPFVKLENCVAAGSSRACQKLTLAREVDGRERLVSYETRCEKSKQGDAPGPTPRDLIAPCPLRCKAGTSPVMVVDGVIKRGLAACFTVASSPMSSRDADVQVDLGLVIVPQSGKPTAVRRTVVVPLSPYLAASIN